MASQIYLVRIIFKLIVFGNYIRNYVDVYGLYQNDTKKGEKI